MANDATAPATLPRYQSQSAESSTSAKKGQREAWIGHKHCAIVWLRLAFNQRRREFQLNADTAVVHAPSWPSVGDAKNSALRSSYLRGVGTSLSALTFIHGWLVIFGFTLVAKIELVCSVPKLEGQP